jgi:hypothetical protein
MLMDATHIGLLNLNDSEGLLLLPRFSLSFL